MAHTLLSHSCLSYLLQGFLDSGPCRDSHTFHRRLLTYRLALYSSYFFDNHLRQLSEVPKDLGELLKKFLSSRGTAFAAMMQLRALYGRGSDPITASNLFTRMSQEVDASTVIHSTALLDHPGLYDDIKSLLLASTPKYIMHRQPAVDYSLTRPNSFMKDTRLTKGIPKTEHRFTTHRGMATEKFATYY